MSPMNRSSSGWDAFTISAPVLQRIRAVTHCSVERATTSRTTEHTERTDATENVIGFHSEGILWAHDAPRKVTRRRAATAKRTLRLTWVYFINWERKNDHNHANIRNSFSKIFHASTCEPQRRRNKIYSGQRDLLLGETLSLLRAPASRSHAHTHTHLHSSDELTVQTWHLDWKWLLLRDLRRMTVTLKVRR